LKRRRERIRTSQTVQAAAKRLRQRQTPAEQALWQRLRRDQIGGLRIRRQHPLGPYVVDFYCAKCRLVIEIDGDIHRFRHRADCARSEWLEARGYHVIRFSNEQVLGQIDWVTTEIEKAVQDRLDEETSS